MTPLTAELEQEAKITSRVLARIPEDKLTWKPHSKSMTLGQLALHIAAIPGRISSIAAVDTLELNPQSFGKPPQPETVAEITKVFEESLTAARDYLRGLSDESAEAMWRAKSGDREIMAMPRKWVLRGIMFNHLYHHRGQLCVYLRLLEIPVPIIYGASADESPLS